MGFQNPLHLEVFRGVVTKRTAVGKILGMVVTVLAGQGFDVSDTPLLDALMGAIPTALSYI